MTAAVHPSSLPPQEHFSLAPASSDSEIASYAPLQTSVEVVSARIKSNARLQSALAALQTYLPQAVTDQAVRSAANLQQLSSQYGTPLVARVDDKISTAIVTLLAAPAYGTAKVAAADSLAYSYTPERLKSTYVATRTRAISAVHTASERVVQLKRQRGEPLWERLTTGLDQLSKNIAAMRTALAEAGTNAVAQAQASERLADLQSKVSSAVAAARAKGAQARALSQELLASVSDAAAQLTQFVESNLTEQQAATVRTLWAKLLEGASVLKETLHIGTTGTASSSRSNSNASIDEVENKSAPASINAAEPAAPQTNGDEHVLTEEVEESEEGSANGASSQARKRSKKSKPGKKADDEKKAEEQ